MKYFAKYLPVEGEIKEGDRWSLKSPFEVHPLPIESKTLSYWKKQFDGPNGQKDFVKVKLFLCSKDIQVGDKMWSEIHGGLKEYIYTESIDFSSVPSSYSGELDATSFKVIGELSPEATWVKEGDEFEEENWRFYNNVVGMAVNKSIGALYIQQDEFNEFSIEIKCPTCKTFH